MKAGAGQRRGTTAPWRRPATGGAPPGPRGRPGGTRRHAGSVLFAAQSLPAVGSAPAQPSSAPRGATARNLVSEAASSVHTVPHGVLDLCRRCSRGSTAGSGDLRLASASKGSPAARRRLLAGGNRGEPRHQGGSGSRLPGRHQQRDHRTEQPPRPRPRAPGGRANNPGPTKTIRKPSSTGQADPSTVIPRVSSDGTPPLVT